MEGIGGLGAGGWSTKRRRRIAEVGKGIGGGIGARVADGFRGLAVEDCGIRAPVGKVVCEEVAADGGG